MLTGRDRAEIKEMFNDALGGHEKCLHWPLGAKWAAIRTYGDTASRLALIIEIQEDEKGLFVRSYAGEKEYVLVDGQQKLEEVM